MIVVVGSPRAGSDDGRFTASGTPSSVAFAAAEGGAEVQVVGRLGEDPAGDAVLLDLARRGVGHVAVLRDAVAATPELPPATDEVDEDSRSATAEPSSLEAADIQLALSYLPEYRVIVVAERLDDDAMGVVVDAADWSGAALVVLGRQAVSDGLPDDVTIFDPPDDGDPNGAFAAMVGSYAAGLDRGDDPRVAFEAAAASVGSTAAE
ncbi:MAG TPA: PfkB family carbohydrate kinase [Candidatus Limnocylindrales bacterium]|nr:PfkB family carbohydrate kinase [Candidatus Limnocylindrales bacterium]